MSGVASRNIGCRFQGAPVQAVSHVRRQKLAARLLPEIQNGLGFRSIRV